MNHESRMGRDHAQALIDLAVVVLGVVAAVYVLKTPSLRRDVWRVLRYGLFTAAPALLWQETTRAWGETQHS
ncbi:MAG: hypothetical protein ACRDF0_12300 [Candidatus Limnocylindria bacterium]